MIIMMYAYQFLCILYYLHRGDYLGMPFQAIEASLSGAIPIGKTKRC